jgi:hypothetical protein
MQTYGVKAGCAGLSDRAAQVQQGFRKGETVILHPTEEIKEGLRVKPR